MNTVRIYLLFISLFLVFGLAQAQTGANYFLTENRDLPNSKIIDIIETADADLVLLSQTSDKKYMYHNINLINYNLSTHTFKSNVVNIENLSELVKLKKQDNQYKIFANNSLNKIYNPIQIDIDKNLSQVGVNEDQVVFSTLISDVTDGINYRLILYTKEGKSEKYNISLHKINLNTQKVVWLKKISSEQNEEADKIIIDPEGNILILGKKYNDNVTEYVPIIYKLDSEGNQIWKKGIDVPNNFNKQSICLSNDNHIIYICGYTKNPTGFSESRVIKLSDKGEELDSYEIKDFSANGMIRLNNDNYLAYGSKFFVDQKQIVTKGKFCLLGKNLKEIQNKALNENDKPDIDLNIDSKTSSDFLIAKELASGKIALGGKVYMPNAKFENKKFNVPLLLIINQDGTY